MRLANLQIHLTGIEARSIKTSTTQRRIATFMQGVTDCPVTGRFRIVSPKGLVGFYYHDSGRIETETWSGR